MSLDRAVTSRCAYRFIFIGIFLLFIARLTCHEVNICSTETRSGTFIKITKSPDRDHTLKYCTCYTSGANEMTIDVNLAFARTKVQCTEEFVVQQNESIIFRRCSSTSNSTSVINGIVPANKSSDVIFIYIWNETVHDGQTGFLNVSVTSTGQQITISCDKVNFTSGERAEQGFSTTQRVFLPSPNPEYTTVLENETTTRGLENSRGSGVDINTFLIIVIVLSFILVGFIIGAIVFFCRRNSCINRRVRTTDGSRSNPVIYAEPDRLTKRPRPSPAKPESSVCSGNSDVQTDMSVPPKSWEQGYGISPASSVMVDNMVYDLVND